MDVYRDIWQRWRRAETVVNARRGKLFRSSCCRVKWGRECPVLSDCTNKIDPNSYFEGNREVRLIFARLFGSNARSRSHLNSLQLATRGRSVASFDSDARADLKVPKQLIYLNGKIKTNFYIIGNNVIRWMVGWLAGFADWHGGDVTRKCKISVLQNFKVDDQMFRNGGSIYVCVSSCKRAKSTVTLQIIFWLPNRLSSSNFHSLNSKQNLPPSQFFCF